MDVPVRAAGRSLPALMHDAALRFGTHRRGYSPCSMSKDPGWLRAAATPSMR